MTNRLYSGPSVSCPPERARRPCPPRQSHSHATVSVVLLFERGVLLRVADTPNISNSELAELLPQMPWHSSRSEPICRYLDVQVLHELSVQVERQKKVVLEEAGRHVLNHLVDPHHDQVVQLVEGLPHELILEDLPCSESGAGKSAVSSRAFSGSFSSSPT